MLWFCFCVAYFSTKILLYDITVSLNVTTRYDKLTHLVIHAYNAYNLYYVASIVYRVYGAYVTQRESKIFFLFILINKRNELMRVSLSGFLHWLRIEEMPNQ